MGKTINDKIKNIKGKILKSLFIDKEVDQFYREFQKQYPDFTKNNKVEAIKYIFRLNYAQYRYRSLYSVKKPSVLNVGNASEDQGVNKVTYSAEKYPDDRYKYYYWGLKGRHHRTPTDELYDRLSTYDVISFDIFDTAIFRMVENPNDVFSIMAGEIGHQDFVNIRKKAESEARSLKEVEQGTREVSINDIYDVLETKYGISKQWMYREEELEIELCVANPYILCLYKKILENKTVVFTSDMYLDKSVLEKMLNKVGYTGYSEIIVSNDYKLRKGDGKLQEVLKVHYPSSSIIHIGDNYNADYVKTKEAGLDSLFNPDQRLAFKEQYLENLSGSFYRAVINNSLNNGLWNTNKYYEHGFRVGGILAAGYCSYINELAKQKNIDKILFCSRDCDIICKAYNKFYKEFDNEYIKISRYAIMNVTTERYLYDLVNRTILRYASEQQNNKTIEQILIECGFDYLVDYLEDNDIDRFRYPCSLDKFREKLEKFVFDHKYVIEQHNQNSLDAAKKYFSGVIGNAKNILIVDIGWSGTCGSALKFFIERHLNISGVSVYGALMCTSRNGSITTSVENRDVYSYIYSPMKNIDLARFMMPINTPVKEQDLLHMPLEYLFTSIERSMIRYELNKDNEVVFRYANYSYENLEEIEEMQKGIIDFISLYKKYSAVINNGVYISSYVAFAPLKEAINHQDYIYEIYKNFTYDAFSVPFSDSSSMDKFGKLFDNKQDITGNDKVIHDKKILFVTPELIYTGAPRSLLRMCKVALELGYYPLVWSAKQGPFIDEYKKAGISVSIVPENQLSNRETIEIIKSCKMAVCNTIVTDKYADLCSKYIPTVWYIREATNIPDFLKGNQQREEILRKSKAICCVSEYAAKAISKYNKNNIMIIHNCVEDESNLATSYVCGSGDTIKFVQFGTMEYRKGYDILVAAYKLMPLEYQEKVELFFAGGFINSGAPYCSYLFSEIKDCHNIHYLGIVKGEENKIKTLSEMDVVVVASRDESCSLVALEGAMLSKPLIVTENVGAKYMVEDNGIIVKNDNVISLRDAMMFMVDNKLKLNSMGKKSRNMYENFASMDQHISDMKQLYSLSNGTLNSNIKVYKATEGQKVTKVDKSNNVIVSLTSHPGRINIVAQTISSLLMQRCQPLKILLYLSKEQFPNKEKDLPDKLRKLVNNIFKIIWVEDDLKPHKKYYYAMQDYPNNPIVIVDDDIIYDSHLIETFVNNQHKFPNCIMCMRGNMMMFNENREFRSYTNWIYNCRFLADIPSYQVMATGVGGVYYPPNAIPREAFDAVQIKNTCLYCDDLWLKLYSVINGIKTVVLKDACKYKEIQGSQEVALWRININGNRNDVSLNNILEHLKTKNIDIQSIKNIITKDRCC